MNTVVLDEVEQKLYTSVIENNQQIQSIEQEEMLQVIYEKYKEVHSTYAQLASYDNEALKRGLFLQWYAKLEPSYLTGLSILDPKSELKIIQLLDSTIDRGELDFELTWMLNYYANWSFAFDQYYKYSGLKSFIENRKDDLMTTQIDREAMKLRGQMGMYWNSLTRYK